MPVPKDPRIRQQILMDKDSNIDLWDALDIEFYKYEDNIVALTLNYVRENISHFDLKKAVRFANSFKSKLVF